MKKLLIIGLALALTIGASAQKGRGGFYSRPRTYVVVGGGFGYSPFYSPFYNPYYPGYYPGYNTYHRPSKLEMQIADIKSDYSDRIWSVKHDTSIPRRQRRKEVHELRHQRDMAVQAAERNYHLRR
ncbi:MAG: hypothetical protein JWM28_2654 [Chitinophagaceae bacterium]|nr:hypothetical protein [Chitinophagaceae bacterium]